MGFNGGVSIRGLALMSTYSNELSYVDSNGSANGDGTFTRPWATLQRAIDKATAGKGDIIVIKAGHAEAVISATALAFNKADITVIGLGKGTSRPTFTFTTANTATIAVSGANFSVENCRFIGNFLSIASCFTVGVAPGFEVLGCFFDDTSATLGFLSILTTTVSVNADGLVYSGNYRRSIATTTPGACISILGTITGVTVQNNYEVHTSISNNQAALLKHAALVVNSLLVTDNIIYSINTDTITGAIVVLTTATTGSGIIARNLVRHIDVAGALVCTLAAVQYGLFENYVQGESTMLTGVIVPAYGAQV
jgi:hypothetical protein